jgi:hypothetical protein
MDTFNPIGTEGRRDPPDKDLIVPELYRDNVGKYWIDVAGVRRLSQVERHA